MGIQQRYLTELPRFDNQINYATRIAQEDIIAQDTTTKIYCCSLSVIALIVVGLGHLFTATSGGPASWGLLICNATSGRIYLGQHRSWRIFFKI